jgi:hypothetical protein
LSLPSARFLNCAASPPDPRPSADDRSKGESKDPEDAPCHADSGSFNEDERATIPAMREGRFYKFWVYIMADRTVALYLGMTGFVDTRIFQHKSGEIEGIHEAIQMHST